MKRYLSILGSSVLAGILIGLAAIVKLQTDRITGSLLFGLGLLLICILDLFLYTGKIGKVLDEKPKYLLDLAVGLAGNFIGIVILCKALLLTSIGPGLKEAALLIVNAKESSPWYSTLILSIFCGFMIYFAVIAYNKSESGFIKALSVMLCITFFILSGYEHCIANAGYYALCGAFNAHMILSFILFILGNSIGSIIIDLLFKLKKIEK